MCIQLTIVLHVLQLFKQIKVVIGKWVRQGLTEKTNNNVQIIKPSRPYGAFYPEPLIVHENELTCLYP